MKTNPRGRSPPERGRFIWGGVLGALMITLPFLIAANLSPVQMSASFLAKERTETEWTIPLRSREPIESEGAAPAWLTQALIWAIFGFAAVNTWLTAPEDGAIAILKRGWRGPQLDQLYLPLLCREQGGDPTAGHWERLRRINRKTAVVFSRQSIDSGTRLRMELPRAAALHSHDDHTDRIAASFQGKVTQCRPIRHDPEWFQIKLRLEAFSTDDPPFSLQQLLLSLAPPPSKSLGLVPSMDASRQGFRWWTPWS